MKNYSHHEDGLTYAELAEFLSDIDASRVGKPTDPEVLDWKWALQLSVFRLYLRVFAICVWRLLRTQAR